MYTQCPQCLTYFQVTPEHLKVAQGNVRCGQCRNVFSALGNLTELPPEAISQSANKSSTQTFADNMSATISDFERDLADEKDAVANPPKSGGLSAAIDKINQLNKRSNTVTRKTSPPPAAKPAIRPAPAAPPSAPPPRELPKPATSSAPYAKPVAKPAAPPPIKESPKTPMRPRAASAGMPSAAMPQNSAAINNTALNTAPNNASVAKKRAPVAPAAKARTRNTSVSLDVDAALSAIDSLDITSERPPQRRVIEEITLGATPEPAAAANNRVKALARPQPTTTNLPAVTRPTSSIPKALLEDFQRAKAAAIMAKQSAKGNIWVIGSVVMMFVFLTQTIYFKYNDLARISSLRPWMERFCHVANCEVSLPFEIKKLELLGQDIRSHPKIRKALLVTVTLMNRAKYPQAYPGLEIKFMDMNSQMVAMRRFLPRDYLAADVNIDAGIPANTPIEVELQLIDPGSKAINFEFDMFRAS